VRFLDFPALRSTLVAGLISIGLAAQAETVRWLHIEQNPDVAAYYTDVARRFESANPGTKIEMQFLENESYKKKLTTLLQSPDKPHIIYSWAGGVLREQVKAGVIEDISTAVDAGWRSRFNPAALNLYSTRTCSPRRASTATPSRPGTTCWAR
jgi:raffinose/stachyose/melibiose transport system substrate-binding protein